MNFGIHQNSSCPGLLPVQCDTEASEPRKRAATDDSPLVVADSPARNEQGIRTETLGARRLHRAATSPNSVLTTGIELISSTSTSCWEARATPSLGKTATTLLPPSTIFTSCGVRFAILISPLSRVSAHSSAKYLQKSRKLLFAVREVAFS